VMPAAWHLVRSLVTHDADIRRLSAGSRAIDATSSVGSATCADAHIEYEHPLMKGYREQLDCGFPQWRMCSRIVMAGALPVLSRKVSLPTGLRAFPV